MSYRYRNILVLDHGVHCAVAALVTLKKILEKLAREKGLARTPEVFDVIASTDAGSWLALLLGIFRSSIDACLVEFVLLFGRIEPHSTVGELCHTILGDSYRKRLRGRVEFLVQRLGMMVASSSLNV